ncbi:PucR family transcriptional regulator [Occultella gossypii]|uniref:Helix-turn-helix domain-containing protein n=1 Tax=Occultella gossypii TaxID=2800820 RepID=A0ABS7SBY2_9MICO|nr:helix-turn-helix domain-containing protein [Occultella gossypii]MBZ2197850.1 helix-turn-helix domain-containing protein [Occultella gossypii]
MDALGEDLFEVAESLAGSIDAPVTIEDEHSTVLAYSADAQTVDDVRIDTILGRQVPGRYRTMLAEAGVFDRLRREPGVVYADLGAGSVTRAVVAVRTGDGALIGSIWAARSGRLAPPEEETLLAAAPGVARLIVAHRARADRHRRLRSRQARTILDGGPEGFDIATELGLTGQITVALAAPVDGPEVPTGLAGALAIHLDARGVRALTAELDATVCAVLAAGEETATRVLRAFTSTARVRDHVIIAVGREAPSPGQAHSSHADAVRILRVLRRRRRPGAVATTSDALADLVALRTEGLLDDLDGVTPLARLVGYDEANGSELVPTVRAFLDHGGDVAVAAAELHVHPNTLRNRLRRAADSCDVDVADPDARLVLMLQFALTALRPASQD